MGQQIIRRSLSCTLISNQHCKLIMRCTKALKVNYDLSDSCNLEYTTQNLKINKPITKIKGSIFSTSCQAPSQTEQDLKDN